MIWLRLVKVCEIASGYYHYLTTCVVGLNSCSTSPSGCCDELSSARIAAIIMGLLLLIVAVICILLTVCIVWNCTSLPMKEVYSIRYAIKLLLLC